MAEQSVAVPHFEGVCLYMRGSRKFCHRGSKFNKVSFLFFVVFPVDEGIEDPSITISLFKFSVFMRVAVLHRFYCIYLFQIQGKFCR